MKSIVLINIIRTFLVLSTIMLVGCTKPPELPRVSVNEAWDTTYSEVVMHVLDCKECSKSFKDYSELGSLEDSIYGGKFSKCPDYMTIYKKSTTFGDWQLYPMGWQWKGPTQEKFIWDYEKQKWQRK